MKEIYTMFVKILFDTNQTFIDELLLTISLLMKEIVHKVTVENQTKPYK